MQPSIGSLITPSSSLHLDLPFHQICWVKVKFTFFFQNSSIKNHYRENKLDEIHQVEFFMYVKINIQINKIIKQ